MSKFICRVHYVHLNINLIKVLSLQPEYSNRDPIQYGMQKIHKIYSPTILFYFLQSIYLSCINSRYPSTKYTEPTTNKPNTA